MVRFALLGADERFVGRIFRDMAPFNNNKSKAGKANVSKRWDKTSEVKSREGVQEVWMDGQRAR